MKIDAAVRPRKMERRSLNKRCGFIVAAGRVPRAVDRFSFAGVMMDLLAKRKWAFVLLVPGTSTRSKELLWSHEKQGDVSAIQQGQSGHRRTNSCKQTWSRASRVVGLFPFPGDECPVCLSIAHHAFGQGVKRILPTSFNSKRTGVKFLSRTPTYDRDFYFP